MAKTWATSVADGGQAEAHDRDRIATSCGCLKIGRSRKAGTEAEVAGRVHEMELNILFLSLRHSYPDKCGVEMRHEMTGPSRHGAMDSGLRKATKRKITDAMKTKSIFGPRSQQLNVTFNNIGGCIRDRAHRAQPPPTRQSILQPEPKRHSSEKYSHSTCLLLEHVSMQSISKGFDQGANSVALSPLPALH